MIYLGFIFYFYFYILIFFYLTYFIHISVYHHTSSGIMPGIMPIKYKIGIMPALYWAQHCKKLIYDFFFHISSHWQKCLNLNPFWAMNGGKWRRNLKQLNQQQAYWLQTTNETLEIYLTRQNKTKKFNLFWVFILRCQIVY